MWETQVLSLGQEDPLGKGLATYSSVLAWRSPWTEETGGVQCVGSQRARHDWVTNAFTFKARTPLRSERAPDRSGSEETSVFSVRGDAQSSLHCPQAIINAGGDQSPELPLGWQNACCQHEEQEDPGSLPASQEHMCCAWAGPRHLCLAAAGYSKTLAAAAWSLSHVWLCATPWTGARQAPLPMGSSRQEYWSGWAFPSPGALSNPEIKPTSPAWQADSLPLSHLGNPRPWR